MSAALTRFTLRYRRALHAALSAAGRPGRGQALALGDQARHDGMRRTALSALHRRMLRPRLLLLAPRRRLAARRRGGRLLAAVLAQPERALRREEETRAQARALVGQLAHQAAELARTRRALARALAGRLAAAAEARAGRREQSRTLLESAHLRQRLRRLARQRRTVREAERKAISRELRDAIAKRLGAITLQLRALRRQAESDSLQLAASRTQRLVAQAVELVHRCARGLRPAVLDDLGLIPALHAALQAFTRASGIRARLIASPRIEQLGGEGRTVLFRVAQEALAAVQRSAQASNVRVTLAMRGHGIGMSIHDDGPSSPSARPPPARRGARAGLLGMRERLETVGGSLAIDSAGGHGTTIYAHIPLGAGPGPARTIRSSSPLEIIP